jgi:hypothetical protein
MSCATDVGAGKRSMEETMVQIFSTTPLKLHGLSRLLINNLRRRAGDY